MAALDKGVVCYNLVQERCYSGYLSLSALVKYTQVVVLKPQEREMRRKKDFKEFVLVY